MRKILKEAGNLYGLSLESKVISLLDAGIHLGYDINKVKRLVANYFKDNINIVNKINSATISNFGITL